MQTPLPGGFLIAIEGIDGAGKTTLAAHLAAQLGHGGTRVHLTKEPTRGPWGTRLRESAATGRLRPEEEAELLLRDRRDHVEQLIAPALARGECVILDRYFPSMVAYQGAAGLDPADLLHANDFAPRPDVLLVLDSRPPHGRGWPASAPAATRPTRSRPLRTWRFAVPCSWPCRCPTSACWTLAVGRTTCCKRRCSRSCTPWRTRPGARWTRWTPCNRLVGCCRIWPLSNPAGQR